MGCLGLRHCNSQRADCASPGVTSDHTCPIGEMSLGLVRGTKPLVIATPLFDATGPDVRGWAAFQCLCVVMLGMHVRPFYNVLPIPRSGQRGRQPEASRTSRMASVGAQQAVRPSTDGPLGNQSRRVNHSSTLSTLRPAMPKTCMTVGWSWLPRKAKQTSQQ